MNTGLTKSESKRIDVFVQQMKAYEAAFKELQESKDVSTGTLEVSMTEYLEQMQCDIETLRDYFHNIYIKRFIK